MGRLRYLPPVASQPGVEAPRSARRRKLRRRASCGACRRLRPTLQHPAVQAVAQVFEVDAHDEPALAAQYGVFHLPALFLLHGADFHAPVEPLLDPAQLAAQLLALQLQPAQDEP